MSVESFIDTNKIKERLERGSYEERVEEAAREEYVAHQNRSKAYFKDIHGGFMRHVAKPHNVDMVDVKRAVERKRAERITKIPGDPL